MRNFFLGRTGLQRLARAGHYRSPGIGTDCNPEFDKILALLVQWSSFPTGLTQLFIIIEDISKIVGEFFIDFRKIHMDSFLRKIRIEGDAECVPFLIPSHPQPYLHYTCSEYISTLFAIASKVK
jgi:hypothetical protein